MRRCVRLGHMNMDKFTVKAQEALQQAQGVARRRDQQEILPEHILAGLLAEQDGLVVPLLQRIGADPKLVSARLDDELKKVPQVHGGEGGHLAQRSLKIFDAAEDEAKKLKDEYVSTEHLLLALAAEKRGAAAEALKARETGKKTSTAEMSQTGVWSERNPREATAEQGRRATEAFVDAAVRFIDRWKQLRPQQRP